MSKATTAFVPYAPLNELKAVAAHVWIVDGPEIRFDYFRCRRGSLAPGARVPAE